VVGEEGNAGRECEYIDSRTVADGDARRPAVAGGESENMMDGPVSSVGFTRVSGMGDDVNLLLDAVLPNFGRDGVVVVVSGWRFVRFVGVVEAPVMSEALCSSVCDVLSGCVADRSAVENMASLKRGVGSSDRGVGEPSSSSSSSSSSSLTYGSNSLSPELIESSLSE
jgi:hypothetical protein